MAKCLTVEGFIIIKGLYPIDHFFYTVINKAIFVESDVTTYKNLTYGLNIDKIHVLYGHGASLCQMIIESYTK